MTAKWLLQQLLKKMRSVLNKITPENFQRLVTQAQDLLLHNDKYLQDITNIIFEKVRSLSLGC
jgi:translation initiation factor 4G